jgi:hypothetical protein
VRSINFRAALLNPDVIAVPELGHPGITTTWLGALAVQLKLWVDPQAATDVTWASNLIWLTPNYGEAFQRLFDELLFGRIVISIANSLGVVTIFLLVRQKLGIVTAIIGGLMLALDPYSAGLSGLLNTDALLATFSVIALLLVVPKRWRQLPTNRAMLFCGIATALAIESKLPGLLLLGFVPLCLSVTGLLAVGRNGWRTQIIAVAQRMLVWLTAVVITAIAVLPALVLAPDAVWAVLDASTGIEVDLVAETFFFGRMTPNPGLIFYPVAALFRLSPLTTIGLLIIIPLLLRQWRRQRNAPPPFVGYAPVFIVLFTLGLTTSARVFDRYYLPNLMLLILLGAIGLALMLEQLAPRRRPYAWAGLALLATLFAAFNWTYPLYATNWLAGGQSTAARIIPIGWGETASAAATWAATQPDAENATLFTTDVPSAAPFFPGETVRLDDMTRGDIRPNDFVLASPIDSEFGSPVYVVAIGNDQMAVYTNVVLDTSDAPQLQMQLLPRRFDAVTQLEAAGWRLATTGDRINVRTDWLALHSADGVVQINLVDDAGNRVATVEQPLANRAGLVSQAWAQGTLYSADYTLFLPPDLASGTYDLTITVFDTDGALQGVFLPDGTFEGTTVLIDRVIIE